jgi:hypothetical protein
LTESTTSEYLASFPLSLPSLTNSVTLFIHGSLSGPSPEGLRLLQCDDLGRPTDGLVPCVELSRQCAPLPDAGLVR